MPLSEYENQIWQSMTEELKSDGVDETIEEREIEKPYALRIVISVLLLVFGFGGMIASVAYKNIILGVSLFVVVLIAGLMLSDAWKYRLLRTTKTNPRNSQAFDEIWKRLGGN